MKSFVFWNITPCSLLKTNYDSEDNVASVFRVEEYVKSIGYSEKSIDFEETTWRYTSEDTTSETY
jgi:hypothetical protein